MRGRARIPPAALLAALSLLANLLGYGFTVVMSRALPVGRFGELSALVGVLVLASVAGTALQAQIARRIAGGERPPAERLLADSAVVGLGVGVVVLAVSPLLRAALDVGSWASLLWLAVAMIPTTFAFGVQGVLQGEHRLVRLGVVLAAVQAAKLAAGIIAGATGGSIPIAFALTAVFTAVVALAAMPLASPFSPGRPTWTRQLVAAWLRDMAAVLGVLVLTSLDLLMARHYLDATASGLYAAGNVVTRTAFWGPAFIALAGYPRFSDPTQRAAALRRAVVTLLVIAAIAVAGAWAAQDLLPVILGNAYRPVAPLALLFAVQGSALAALQLGVYAGLAAHDRRAAGGLWLGAAVEVLLVAMVWHADVRQIITVSTLCSLAMVGLTVALLAGRARRPEAYRSAQWAASSQVRPTPTETSSGTAPRE